MAVRIRMKRTGGTNNSCYRVVVMDQCAQRDGKAIEEIGFYNPNSKVETLKVDRYDYWVSVGAQPSETVKDVANRVKNNISLADLVRKPTISKKAKAKLEAEAKAKAEAEAAAAEAAAAEEAPAEA
ncbi:MAG: 30S ribosomal protein S16 [Lentisphaerae bacterium]|nr:30S ribosomal protein S16 [Lentisphaerota bacterium]